MSFSNFAPELRLELWRKINSNYCRTDNFVLIRLKTDVIVNIPWLIIPLSVSLHFFHENKTLGTDKKSLKNCTDCNRPDIKLMLQVSPKGNDSKIRSMRKIARRQKISCIRILLATREFMWIPWYCAKTLLYSKRHSL